MHLIDTVVTQFDIYDEVTAEKRDDDEISVNYRGVSGKIEGDTAYRAAKLIQSAFNTRGVDISVVKRIPFKAGLGGSSADAGGVARCMRELFGLPEIPCSLLLQVGSDVPYMYLGGNKRIRGIGERVTEVDLPKLYKVLITDQSGVNTAECYKNYDIYGGENQDIETFFNDLSSQNARFTNALQRAGERLNGNIKHNAEILRECGFRPCMTGSGSGVFGIEYDRASFDAKIQTLANYGVKYFVG